ncbi:MAG: single-stranded-DNA-specific exonuclease RecJ, partial [Minisyncoccia bacterium]
MPYDDLTNHLLAKRGITTEAAAERFLSPSYDEHLVDPLTIKNMPEAARRLAAAILSGEKIVVWSDYDCDGVPAGVILHDFLKKAGATFENYIPHRHFEGYGVNSAGIEKLAERGTKLLVTADVGITDAEAIAKARALGMDTIVTDHHLGGEELPEGIVVDPNAHADETADFKSWCGAGLAWKLVCATLAVEPRLREKVPVGWEKWLLDMAALATIADMVPLVGDNRLIALYGLKVLRKSPRVGLQRLCRLMRVEQSRITEDDVGFMLAPR